MRRFLLCAALLLVTADASFAQGSAAEAEIRKLVPFEALAKEVPGLTRADYDAAISAVANKNFLGTMSANPYSPTSTSNPHGTYGSPYSPRSITNPYSEYGSPYSRKSATNPYSNSGPKLYGRDGTYLGRVNNNAYDPESIANPYGRYGSRYSSTSINNPYGRYGSPYSPYSATNPYSTQAPVLLDDEDK